MKKNLEIIHTLNLLIRKMSLLKLNNDHFNKENEILFNCTKELTEQYEELKERYDNLEEKNHQQKVILAKLIAEKERDAVEEVSLLSENSESYEEIFS